MAIDNGFILQQILQEQSKSNDNLTAMRDILADSLKLQQRMSRRGGNNGGGNPPPNGGGNPPGDRRRRGPGGPPAGGSGDMFKNIFGELKNFSRTALGNNATASNVVNSFGTSLNSVVGPLKMIPGPVGAAATAFTMVVDAGMAVYNYMNEQLNMYNKLNSAGLTLRDGMLSARKASVGSYMSLNEFNDAIQKNSVSIAAMDGQYGDGIQTFSNLMGSLQDLQQINGIYGVSQQQLADIAAKNFKYEKLYSSQSALRAMDQAQSTAGFVTQMTALSKSVGKSVDDLLGKFDSMGNTLDSTVSQYAMSDNWGFDQDKAAEVTKGMNAAYSSMGETGQILQKINASRLSLFQLPDEYNNQFMQQYADMMEQIQRSGITDAKTIRNTMHEYVQNHQDQLKKELVAQQMSGNVQAAALLTQIQNQEKLFNESNTNTNAQLEQYTSNFNIWISKTFTKPFNDMYGKLQLSTMKYLSDLADRSDGAFDFMANLVKDGFAHFDSGMTGAFGLLMDIPAKIAKILLGDSYDKIAAEFNNMMGDIVQIPVRIGSLIWDWLTGSDMTESQSKLKGTVHSIFSDFDSYWKSITDIKFSYSDMKTRISDAFESMKKSISGWWDTAKGWFSNEDPIPDEGKKTAKNGVPKTSINTNTTEDPITTVVANKPQQPPVLATPPNSNPEKISEDAKKDDNQNVSTQAPIPAVDYDESILSTLKNIASAMDSANSTNQQTAQLLRQISENTEAQRQT